jgi:hypothetical protein
VTAAVGRVLAFLAWIGIGALIVVGAIIASRVDLNAIFDSGSTSSVQVRCTAHPSDGHC